MDRMDMIIAKLQERGYTTATIHEVVKNGITKKGITIRESNISPVIYVDTLLKNNENIELDDLVTQIINIYESHKSVDFDVDLLTSRDFLLNNTYIGLQRCSSENIIKRDCTDFEGLEQYLYARGMSDQQGSWNMKIHSHILEKAGIGVDEIWASAEMLTFSEDQTVIQPLSSIMAEIFGTCEDDCLAELDIPMFVISNRDKIKGAAQVLDRERLKAFAAEHNTEKLVILPSSLHEMILIVPAANEILDEEALERYSSLVAEVNATQVDEEEQMIDKAFLIDFSEDN